MRVIKMMLYVVLVLSLSSIAGASEVSKDTITVTGKAAIEQKPDVCYVTLYAKGDGILMVDAVKEVNRKVTEIVNAVKEKHGNVKEIDVAEVGLGEKQSRYWSSEQKDEPPRPEAIKRIRITISPDMNLTHEIIDTAIRSGAIMKIPSDVHYSGKIDSVVAYGLLEASEITDDVQTKAIEDAEKNAEKLASLVGKKAGTVVSIGCNSSFPQRMIVYPEEDFPTKYVGTNPDKIEVSYSITMTFELLDK